MKKVALSLAGVLAAAAFAPEASALPVFARQTGMACNACHFNHFPLLNGFGRSFKSSGFTLMGAQGKVEGDNLSLPDRLNMAVLTTAAYENISGNAPSSAWSLPGSGGELSLFFGGKISDNAGFLSELGTTGPAAALGAAKLPMMFDVAGAKVGLVFDTNGGQGAAHSFELLNTGAVNVHKIVSRGHETVYSAAQWLGTNFATSGASVVAQHDIGFINVTKYDAAPVGMGAGATGLPLTYARIAYTGDLAGFDFGAGVQSWTGTTTGAQFGAVQASILAGDYKATVVDAQLQGELGGFSTGLYASYGTAPVGSMLGQGAAPAVAAVGAPAVVANAFKATSFNMGADVELAHGVTGKLAFRAATNGADGLADNAVQIGGSYQLAQNLELGLIYTSNSGAHWNGAGVVGKTVTTLMMEALF
jgi:hypothetical protein